MRLFRIYLQSARLDLQLQFAYRASALIWLFSMLLEPIVFMMVWRAVALAQGGTTEGYSQGGITAYFLTLMVVNHLTFTWIMHEYAYRILEGKLSGLLLLPLHPIHRDITLNFSYKLLVMVVVVPLLALLSFYLKPEFELELWQVFAFIPSLVLAAATRFLMEWLLALSAFWYIETSSFNQAYMVTLMFFSGRLAPIAMFPEWLSEVAQYLPFWLTVAFPVELLLGILAPRDAIQGMLLQCFWMGLFVVSVSWVWNRAVYRFGAVGG